MQFSCSLGTIPIVYAKYIYAYICGWLQMRYIECGVKQRFLLELNWNNAKRRPKLAKMESQQQQLVTIIEQEGVHNYDT